MAASKLSPQERLMRKRTAARLRQQRCRARKRQAMLERANNKTRASTNTTTTTKTSSSISTAPPRKVSLPPRKLWKSRLGSLNPHANYWSDDSSDDSALRSRTTSFDSISSSGSIDSLNEDHSQLFSSPSMDVCSSPSPVKFDRRLPQEEEAAVDAMLSLKQHEQAARRRRVVRPVPTVVTPLPLYYSQQHCWNNSTVYYPRPRILPLSPPF